ncbi:MAG: ABC transporter permease subunit [Blastocatellia bacterium]|nr:ABC transporter permease subunit [Blastocatellia bacterium]
MAHEIFRVFGNVRNLTRIYLAVMWTGAFFLLWVFSPIKALPYPSEVWHAVGEMWNKYALGYHVLTTIKLNVVGLVYSTVLSLVISYLSVVPLVQPVNKFVQILRYIPIIGFNLIFLAFFPIGWALKVAMLTAGMSFFLVTSMTGVIQEIPQMRFELAKVLGYNDWQVFYTVVMRPTLPHMLDMVAQNAAIGWVMIASIESFNRTEGGIGSQIAIATDLSRVYAYLFIIGIIALVEDFLFVLLKRILFPYSLIAERG